METPKNDPLERLSRTTAMTLVLARAFNLWNQRLEAQARRLRQTHTQETKMFLGQIQDGCAKIQTGCKHFEDWAIRSGITDSGHTGDWEAMESYINDGAWVAYLAGATFNAAKYHPELRLQIESLCKNMTKGAPLIEWSDLEDLKPK